MFRHPLNYSGHLLVKAVFEKINGAFSVRYGIRLTHPTSLLEQSCRLLRIVNSWFNLQD